MRPLDQGSLVRLDQGLDPRRVAEPGARHVDHERRMPGRLEPSRFKQARTQLKGVCSVRKIEMVEVYSRDEERCRQFAELIDRIK